MFNTSRILTLFVVGLAVVGLVGFVASAQQLEKLDCASGTFLGAGGAFDCASTTGGSTSYSVISAPSTLNPVTNNDTASASVADHVFGASGTLGSMIFGNLAGGAAGTVPQVASVIEVSEDGTTITYTIRDGLQYSDGSDFVMDDILYWYHDVTFNPNLPNSATAAFSCASDGAPFAYNVTGALTLEISCADPFRTFSGNASGAFVMSKEMALELINDQGIATEEGINGPRATAEFLGLGVDLNLLRGLGPFVFTELDSQSIARYERNPFFYEVDSNGTQLPYLDELTVQLIPTQGQNLAVQNFLSGQTEVLPPRPGDIAPILGQAASGGLTVNSDIDNGTAATGTTFVTINYDDANSAVADAARNASVRRALSLAIDRVAAVNNVLLGIGAPQFLPITISDTPASQPLSTFFVGRNNTCATFAQFNAPCDDATGLITGRSGLALQVRQLPPMGLTEQLDELVGCLFDQETCYDQANAILDAEGYTDSDGDGVRNLLDGSNWRVAVTTNSGNTIREGYTQIVCDGWIQLGIDCSASTTSFATLVSQLLGIGGATWSGGIVIGLTGGDPAGSVNVLQCGQALYFWHLSCDPEATSGPTAQTPEDAAIEAGFDAGFSATTIPDAVEGFDAMQAAFSQSQPYLMISIPNALFAVRTDRLCNDSRSTAGFTNVKYRVDVPGNEGSCATNVGR